MPKQALLGTVVSPLGSMLTAEDTFRMIVGLAEVSDGDLFEVVTRSDSVNCPPCHVAAFRGLGQELQRLIHEYRYVESPRFLNSIQSKSAPVAEMMRKSAADPVRRRADQKRFVEALGALPEDRSVFTWVAERHHDILFRALAALEVARKNTAQG